MHPKDLPYRGKNYYTPKKKSYLERGNRARSVRMPNRKMAEIRSNLSMPFKTIDDLSHGICTNIKVSTAGLDALSESISRNVQTFFWTFDKPRFQIQLS